MGFSPALRGKNYSVEDLEILIEITSANLEIFS